MIETALIETVLIETALIETALIETVLIETALIETALIGTALIETALIGTALIETTSTQRKPLAVPTRYTTHIRIVTNIGLFSGFATGEGMGGSRSHIYIQTHLKISANPLKSFLYMGRGIPCMYIITYG